MPRRKRPSRVFVHQTPNSPNPKQPTEGDAASSSGSGFVIEELPHKQQPPGEPKSPPRQ